MKYFLADYITRDGEHEYSEYGVIVSSSDTDAERQARRGKKLFTRYGWEEFCEFYGVHEIPAADYKVLKKYYTNITIMLTCIDI